MTAISRLSLLSLTLTLVACGPGAKISGKEGAAQALLAASAPSSKSATGQGIDIPLSISYSCPEGGRASIGGFTAVVGSGAAQAFTLGFENCGAAKSDVGVAIYNGSLRLEQAASASTTNVSVSQKFTGKVVLGGAFDDFLVADVTQAVAVADLGKTGATVAMTLKGTIETSLEKYTFDEAVSVSAGTIKAELPKRN